jgi:hypothetical protein
MTAAKEAITATPIPTPTNFVDIQSVPVEQEVPCRVSSNLPFVGPNGIFTKIDTKAIRIPIRGVVNESIQATLTLNTTNPPNRIFPGKQITGCNMDGVMYLAGQSANVATVADPIYLRSNGDSGIVTAVILFFTRANKSQPASLGVRVKFEEGVGDSGAFNPKRKMGTVTFP